MASTSTPLTLPVLPLDDEVVLPGMVVPLDLNDAMCAPRWRPPRPPRGRSPASRGAAGATHRRGVPEHGRAGTVEQVGRLADGDPGALIRGRGRVRFGAGTTGPAPPVGRGHPGRRDRARPAARPCRRAGQGVQGPRHQLAAQARRLQVVDRVQAIDDVSALADNSGYSPFLSTEQKVTLLETADPVARLKLATEQWREHLAEQDVAESIAKDVQEGVDKQQREFLLRRQLEAVRKELRELNGDAKEGEESDDYRTRVEAADLPRTSARPRSRKSTSWSGPATSRPRAAGLRAPGSTRSWNCRGTSGPRTSTTSRAPRASWTPSTPVWRT